MRRLIPLLGLTVLLANDCPAAGVDPSLRYTNIAGVYVGPIDVVTIVLNDTITLVGTLTLVIEGQGQRFVEGTRAMAGKFTESNGVEITVQSTATLFGRVQPGDNPLVTLSFQDTACPNMLGEDRFVFEGNQLVGSMVIDIADAQCNRVFGFTTDFIADRQ